MPKSNTSENMRKWAKQSPPKTYNHPTKEQTWKGMKFLRKNFKTDY